MIDQAVINTIKSEVDLKAKVRKCLSCGFYRRIQSMTYEWADFSQGRTFLGGVVGTGEKPILAIT